MMRAVFLLSMALIFCVLTPVKQSKAQFWLNIESGFVYTGYNEVRIPGNSGTYISFSDELNHKPNLHLRLNLGYRMSQRSEWLLLWAPLQLEYKGKPADAVSFQGETFPAGTDVTATYRFHSYRATYRYYVWQSENLDLAAGLTLKARDALIAIEGSGRSAEKTDFGFVPLIHFMLHWEPLEKTGILLQADALGVRQGRAADVLLALRWQLNERIGLQTGYRLLEGGSDTNTVYTFSLFHYGVIGLNIQVR